MTGRCRSRARAAAPLLLTTGAALAAPLLLAGPAAASCAGPTTPASLLAQDGGVVLGTADEVRGSRARLRVEEVWSGEDRAPRTWVVTGETGRGAASSVDVRLVEGDRYLLALHGDRTSVCSVLVVGPGRPVAAPVTSAQVEAARPSGARPPAEGADAGDAPGPPLAAVAAGVLGWAGITALVLLAGSRPGRSRRRRSADGGQRPLR